MSDLEPRTPGPREDTPDTPRLSVERTQSSGVIGPFTAKHIWAVTGGIAVAVIFLVAVASPFGTGAVSSGAAPTLGTSFYLLGEPGTGLGIGNRPPPFALNDEEQVLDLDGEVVDLAALRGRPAWVIFWATWCPPCQQETPDVQRAWETNADSGLQIIAVDVQESDDVARDYARTYGLTYRIAVDRTGSAFRNWTVFGLPTHYFIDRDGLIQDRFFGPLAFEQMRERLNAITAP